MNLLHLSDLHIGKRVNEYSMLEDQKYILNEILNIIHEKKVQTVLIAGDIYDKSVPPAEAVAVLDEFLTKLMDSHIEVFMISGNHDSQERLNFGSRIMDKNGVHIAGRFQGNLCHYALKDEYGIINVYLLPFLKPAMLLPYFEEEIESYEKAIEFALSTVKIDKNQRNLLIAHQFVTNAGQKPVQSDSENVSLGGVEEVDYKIFDDFDYVALGHIHRSQSMGRKTVRYAGSPLKYSFSEVRHEKSVTLITWKEKENLKYEKIPLIPIRDMRQIKGKLEQLTDSKIASLANCEDYIHAILTDEEDIMDAIGKLRIIYPNIMRLDLENKKTCSQKETEMLKSDQILQQEPLKLFSEFYKNQNNINLDEIRMNIMEQLILELKEKEGE